MELTRDLLISALEALLDRSLARADEYRQAAMTVDDPEVAKGLRDLADFHSKRLAEASELLVGIRAHGLDNLAIFQ